MFTLVVQFGLAWNLSWAPSWVSVKHPNMYNVHLTRLAKIINLVLYTSFCIKWVAVVYFRLLTFSFYCILRFCIDHFRSNWNWASVGFFVLIRNMCASFLVTVEHLGTPNHETSVDLLCLVSCQDTSFQSGFCKECSVSYGMFLSVWAVWKSPRTVFHKTFERFFTCVRRNRTK